MQFRQVDIGPGHFRIEAVGEVGKVVGWATVLPITVRFPGTWVKVAGVAGVGTHRDHRMSGVARGVMREVQRRATEAGYPVCFLFGIPRLYHKFGYAVTHVEQQARLQVRDLESTRLEGEVRPLREGDWPSALSLYEACTAGQVGVIQRSLSSFRGLNRGPRLGYGAEGWGAFEGDALLAYCAFDTIPQDGWAAHWHDLYGVHLSEVMTMDWRGLGLLLQEAVRRAVERRVEHLYVHGAPSQTLFRFLRRYGSVATTTTPHSGGGMMQVLLPEALMSALAQAWCEALTARCVPWSGVLRLELSDGGAAPVAVRISRDGEVKIVPGNPAADATLTVSPGAMAQLLVGFSSLEDLLATGHARVTGRSECLERMFETIAAPCLPYAYHATRF